MWDERALFARLGVVPPSIGQRKDTRGDPCSEPQRLAHRARRRFAMLIDAAGFFGAVRQAALQARHSILIMGWDIDSRTRLVGESGEPDDRFPQSSARFWAHWCDAGLD